MVGRVRHRQVAVGLQPVGEEVVEHAPVLAAQHRVLGAPDRELRDVVGEQPLQQRLRAGARGFDLAHVRDVEHADVLAHRHVLLADALVLDGISQPANSTSFAPASTWRSYRAVRRGL